MPPLPADSFDAAQVLGIGRGNPARARELVKEFLALLPEEKAKIAEAFAAQDLETVRQSAHRLTSGGRYTGFLRIGQAAASLEELITEGSSRQRIDAAVAELLRDIQTVLEQPEAVWLAELESSIK